MANTWYLYILQCRNDSYYTGITTDIPARLETHNVGKGAKYTRSRLPCRLVYFEECGTESEARRRECEIKKWRREKKHELVCAFPASALKRAKDANGA